MKAAEWGKDSPIFPYPIRISPAAPFGPVAGGWLDLDPKNERRYYPAVV